MVNNFQDTLDKYITPYYKAQTAKKKADLDELAKRYDEINSKLQVRKVYDIKLDTEIHCEECYEIVHNHIEECPICKAENASTNSYCSLYEDEKTIQCDKCGSYLKLIRGKWYGWEEYSPKVIVVSEEEYKAEKAYKYKYK